MLSLRLPAEWEPQDAILMAWPHEATDWAYCLNDVEATYGHLIAAITQYQYAIVLVPSDKVRLRAEHCLQNVSVNLTHLRFVLADYDDTWLRDSGPITLIGKSRYQLLDFHFTGWGGKFDASSDDRIVETLYQRHLFKLATHQRIDFALEGGAIDCDGNGTLLSTWRCLNQRHPKLSQVELANQLNSIFHTQRTLILQHGYLEGDDTDAHIDTLARFVSPEHIVYQACDQTDDPHFTELAAMGDELIALRQLNNQPYQVTALPWARPIHTADGRRLAASYANFLIINDAVLVPAYDDPADSIAAQVLAKAFPQRKIISIPCRSLIQENGSLHCITMQLPQGCLQAI